MNSPHRTAASLWGDRLGRPATRAAQVLVLLALASCVVFALARLSLLVIPVLIALILAAALAPVVRFGRLRRARAVDRHRRRPREVVPPALVEDPRGTSAVPEALLRGDGRRAARGCAERTV